MFFIKKVFCIIDGNDKEVKWENLVLNKYYNLKIGSLE